MGCVRYTIDTPPIPLAHIVKPHEGGLCVSDDTSRTTILLGDSHHPGYSHTV
jgi:hypothetical protein